MDRVGLVGDLPDHPLGEADGGVGVAGEPRGPGETPEALRREVPLGVLVHRRPQLDGPVRLPPEPRRSRPGRSRHRPGVAGVQLGDELVGLGRVGPHLPPLQRLAGDVEALRAAVLVDPHALRPRLAEDLGGLGHVVALEVAPPEGVPGHAGVLVWRDEAGLHGAEVVGDRLELPRLHQPVGAPRDVLVPRPVVPPPGLVLGLEDALGAARLCACRVPGPQAAQVPVGVRRSDPGPARQGEQCGGHAGGGSARADSASQASWEAARCSDLSRARARRMAARVATPGPGSPPGDRAVATASPASRAAPPRSAGGSPGTEPASRTASISDVAAAASSARWRTRP